MKEGERQEETFSKMVIHAHSTEEDFMPESVTKSVFPKEQQGAVEGGIE